MKKSDVLALFDGTTKTAKALGTSKSTVSNWGDDLPWKWALLVEKVTKGALKYSLHIPCIDITDSKREELNHENQSSD
jgi:transcriptional repressor of cell division inhibition gene dicB